MVLGNMRVETGDEVVAVSLKRESEDPEKKSYGVLDTHSSNRNGNGFSMHMLRGSGAQSYYANSSPQSKTVQTLVYPLIRAAVQEMSLCKTERVVKVADFGCSSSMNSIVHMDFVVQNLRSKYIECGCLEVPEFQVFFSDLPANDFNTLFQLLSQAVSCTRGAGETPTGKASDPILQYLSAGVPGSFYGRLFPRASLHFTLSTFSLHWLSKIPSAILDKESPSYNSDHIWILKTKPAVVDAYAAQSMADKRAFFQARAEELIPGGMLVVQFLGRRQGDRRKQARRPGSRNTDVASFFEEAWNELVMEGIIEPSARDGFNMPIYGMSVSETKQVLQECCATSFELVNLEFTEENVVQTISVTNLDGRRQYAKLICSIYRTLYQELMDGSVGADGCNKIMERFESKMMGSIADSHTERYLLFENIISLVLKRL